MRQRRTRTQYTTLAAVAVIAFGVPAVASAAIQWDFTGGGQIVYDASTNTGTTFSAGNVDVDVSGWASDGTPSATTPIADFNVKAYGGGLGVDRPGEGNPEHATDNNGPDEFVLFSFEEAITLASVTAGWPSSTSSLDSDITVLAWTDGGAATVAGRVYDDTNANSLTENGWSFVGHYANVSDAPGMTVSVNDGSQAGGTVFTSSYWMVGAYNPAISPSGFSSENDYIKIAGLSGDTPPDTEVPEPTTLGLALAGLLLAGRARRRRA